MIATLRHQWSSDHHSKNLIPQQSYSQIFCQSKSHPFFSVALGEFHLNKKRNYFEVKIEKIDYKESVLVGVANRGINYEKDPVGEKGFWGCQPLM